MNKGENKIMSKGGRILMACLMLFCLIISILTPTAYAAEPIQVTLTVKQVVVSVGLTVPQNKAFAYRLTSKTNSAPMPEGSGSDGYTFTISGTNAAKIAPITFSVEGSYIYELKCVSDADENYTIDKTAYTIEINITDDLTAFIIIHLNDGDKVDEMCFEHIYGEKIPGYAVDTTVEKIVSGNPKTQSAFTFELKAENPLNLMPAGSADGVKTIRITGAGKADFGKWNYTKEGVYRYTVLEIDSGVKGYTYDTEIYTITDTVTTVNGKLVGARVITNRQNKQVTGLTFTNKYDEGKDGPKTGDDLFSVFDVIVFSVGGVLALGAMVYFIVGGKRKGGAKDI